MGDTLTSTTIGALNFSPILLLFNGYWMISNKQIFENKWNYIQVDGDPMKSSHLVNHFEVNWASPLLMMALCSSFIIVFQVLCHEFLQDWGFTMKGKDIIVDEDLPPFLEAVGLRQADEIVMEAQNCKFNYGIEIHDPRIVEKLDYTVMPTK
jgi:hypothetical protein